MATSGECSRAGELRPDREWGLDPMWFAHVHLLGFDLLALRPAPHMQGSFSRKGRPVRKVEIMGIVVAVDRKERYLRFTMDDGTGCVPCILWTNQASFPARTLVEGLGLQARQELSNGTAAKVKLGEVLRVQGRLSTFANQIQVTVASLQVEQDPNAEVLHWVECMRLAKCCYDLDPPSPKRNPLITDCQRPAMYQANALLQNDHQQMDHLDATKWETILRIRSFLVHFHSQYM